jgi:hypothetical protein
VIVSSHNIPTCTICLCEVSFWKTHISALGVLWSDSILISVWEQRQILWAESTGPQAGVTLSVRFLQIGLNTFPLLLFSSSRHISLQEYQFTTYQLQKYQFSHPPPHSLTRHICTATKRNCTAYPWHSHSKAYQHSLNTEHSLNTATQPHINTASRLTLFNTEPLHSRSSSTDQEPHSHQTIPFSQEKAAKREEQQWIRCRDWSLSNTTEGTYTPLQRTQQVRSRKVRNPASPVELLVSFNRQSNQPACEHKRTTGQS